MSINELRADYLLDKYLYSKDFSGLSTGLSSWFIPALFSISILICLLLLVRKILSFRRTFKEQSILLELTPPATTEKTAHATQELFKTIHRLGREKSLVDRLLGKKTIFSCEIVSTQKEGIRYLVRTAPNQINNLKRNLLSYLPEVGIKTVNEYLPSNVKQLYNYYSKVVEFRLAKHFAYPLQRQKSLEDHDPVAYITGAMTKLNPGELIALQVVLSATQKSVTAFVKHKILRGEDVLGYVNQLNTSNLAVVLKIPLLIISKLLNIVAYILRTIINDAVDAKMAARQAQYQYIAHYSSQNQQRPARILTQFEQEVVKSVEEKIDQPLFEVKIRLFVGVNSKHELIDRVSGISSSFNIFSSTAGQELKKKWTLFSNINFLSFKKRLLSLVLNNSPMVLSISEVSDLYHFPFASVSQTEDLVQSFSKELPTPLSLKQQKNLDLTFAKNTYGGSETLIGLTPEERMRHVYMLGATGTGKTTLLMSAISEDIKNGKGVCLIDPHGDFAKTLLNVIPKEREKDVIYFDPFDIKHPMAINLLEYTSEHLDEDDVDLEKDFISESVVSVFRKTFSNEQTNSSPHRIEYVLRNSVQTALTLKERNLFTIYDLLNDPDFRKQALVNVTDGRLLKFWENEMGKAGDYQQVKMAAGITSKIGRFLFSPIATRILDHQKSSLNFDQILDEGKILICNLSKGNIGEDTSQVLGILILARMQLAILKRSRIDAKYRKPYYLYVDEFQNFATRSFIDMMAESRKYGLYITVAEQSTSQQDDRNLTHRILANTGTVICFKTANPEDEKLILPQFKPNVQEGEIFNLPSFHFFMKLAAIKPQAPFSGETMLLNINEDPEKAKRIIQFSRDKYSTKYTKPAPVKYVPKDDSKKKEYWKPDDKPTSKPPKTNVSKPATYLTPSS